MEKETDKKSLILNNLNYVLGETVIPELGKPFQGKIREIFQGEKHLIMVASDRVSAFDHILDSLIPFKGAILNSLSSWAFKQTENLVPNALVDEIIDPNVLVQRRLKPFPVEFIVRGYLWGSLAAAYEKSIRTYSGVSFKDGLLRYQKFDEPVFTPTTKAPQGEHDAELTYSEVEKLIGAENAQKAMNYSRELYKRGSELALKGNLILIDTKYEFGIDDNGEIFVIDEVNTPDSSRLCDVDEWSEKFPQIEAIFATGKYANVTKLLTDYPELKIKEYSKQFVRDLLLEKGFSGGETVPSLTSDDIAECTCRYIQVYERLTGKNWQPPSCEVSPQQRLYNNLVSSGFIKGCCTMILGGSSSDKAHLEAIEEKINKFDIPTNIRICSAHKQARKLMDIIDYCNRSIEPLIMICCAGGTDALSGTVSYHSFFPSVTCPPDGYNNSCLTNPPGSSNAYIQNKDNVAKFVLQAFSSINPKYKAILKTIINSKISDLEKADTYKPKSEKNVKS